MRFTWSKEKRPKGLAGIGSGPLGAVLKVDGEVVGRVHPRCLGLKFQWDGWYWVAVGKGVPLRNSYSEATFFDTVDDAKVDCEAYVRGCLGKKGG